MSLYASFLSACPLLTHRDQRDVLQLLSGRASAAAADAEHSTADHNLSDDTQDALRATPKWSHCASVSGIKVFKTAPRLSGGSMPRVYRVQGMGAVPERADAVFDLLCNIELIPEWDMLFKGARYLSYEGDGNCEVAHIHVTYGLPGVSRLIHDRDFVLRSVRVFFPDGVCALFCRSLGPEERVKGVDVSPASYTIRGHMWESGYVVVPSPGGCVMKTTLQVDPKGWVPTQIVNLALEAVPLNIVRIRSVVQQLPQSVLDRLPYLNREQALRAKEWAPGDASDTSSSGGASRGGRDQGRSGGGAAGALRMGSVEREVWRTSHGIKAY